MEDSSSEDSSLNSSQEWDSPIHRRPGPTGPIEDRDVHGPRGPTGPRGIPAGADEDVPSFLNQNISPEDDLFCQEQAEALKNKVWKKVIKLKVKVKAAWDEINWDLDDRMKEMAARGYCGFEFYEHPYLGHPRMSDFFADLFYQLGAQGKYMLYYNVKSCAVAVVFNKKYIKEESLTVGDHDSFNQPIFKAVTFTTTDRSKKRYKNFKRKTQETLVEFSKLQGEVRELGEKINQIYYTPGMPGCLEREKNFAVAQKKLGHKKSNSSSK